MSTNYLKYYGQEPHDPNKTISTKFVVRTPQEIAQSILAMLKLRQAQSNK